MKCYCHEYSPNGSTRLINFFSNYPRKCINVRTENLSNDNSTYSNVYLYNLSFDEDKARSIFTKV